MSLKDRIMRYFLDRFIPPERHLDIPAPHADPAAQQHRQREKAKIHRDQAYAAMVLERARAEIEAEANVRRRERR